MPSISHWLVILVLPWITSGSAVGVEVLGADVVCSNVSNNDRNCDETMYMRMYTLVGILVFGLNVRCLDKGQRARGWKSNKKDRQNSFKVPLGFLKDLTRELPLELLAECLTDLHIRADTLPKFRRF